MRLGQQRNPGHICDAGWGFEVVVWSLGRLARRSGLDNGRQIEHHMYSGGMGRFERDCIGGLGGNRDGVCTIESAGSSGPYAVVRWNLFARQQKTYDFDAIWQGARPT